MRPTLSLFLLAVSCAGHHAATVPSTTTPVSAVSAASPQAVTGLPAGEWKFAKYFDGVKEAVATKWQPIEALKAQHVPLPWVDSVVVLQVTLKPDGGLADVIVQKTSKIAALDHEAIRAFKSAQPFDPPPNELVEEGVCRFAFSLNLINK